MKLTGDMLKDMPEPNVLTKDEWLGIDKTWCCVCQRFYNHWWNSERSFGPIMNTSLKVGGWYCSWHDMP